MSGKKQPDKQARNRRKRTRTSWRPGQSGNLAGRPPASNCLTGLLRELGQELHSSRMEGRELKGSNAELLARRLWALARAGNLQAAKLIFDRLEGQATARTEVKPWRTEHVSPDLSKLTDEQLDQLEAIHQTLGRDPLHSVQVEFVGPNAAECAAMAAADEAEARAEGRGRRPTPADGPEGFTPKQSREEGQGVPWGVDSTEDRRRAE